MLILRSYKIDEYNEIRNILIREGIKDLELEDIIYVVLDNDDLVGVAKAKSIDTRYMLEYLVIREDKRNQNLGDALLRAILSKLLNQGVNIVYSKLNDSYLLKKGFIINNDNLLELNISDFFDRGCNDCGGCNELQWNSKYFKNI